MEVGPFHEVMSLELPPGQYTLSATLPMVYKALIESPVESGIMCKLTGGASALESITAVGSSRYVTVSMAGAATVGTGQRVSVACQRFTEQFTIRSFGSASLVATRVGSLTTSFG